MKKTFGFGEQKSAESEVGGLIDLFKTALNPMTYITFLGVILNLLLITLPAAIIDLFAPFLVTWVQNFYAKNPPKSTWHPFYLFSKEQYAAQLMRDHYRESEDPLLSDRLDDCREQAFPRAENEDLWMNLRSDMDPGIIFESKLIGGQSLTEMSKTYATDQVINAGLEQGRDKSGRRVIASAIGMMVIFGLLFGLNIDIHIPARDIWDESFLTSTLDALTLTLPVILGLALATVLNPMTYISAASNGLMSWLMAGSKNVHYAISSASTPFRRSTKQSIVGAKRNASNLQVERKDFLRIAIKNENYLKQKGLDRSVKIGTATGAFRSRGVSGYSAPLPDQEVRFDLEALTKGFAVIGQTGSGKTSNVLLPVFRSLLADEKRGFFIMDGKSVLWKQCEEIVAKYAPERLKDMVVIGTGSYKGVENFGVDVLKGLRPSQVSETARSVMEQLSSSSGGDDYWPNAASQMIEHAARIALAYEITDEGVRYTEKTGRSPYSLMFIYDLIKTVELREDVGIAISNATRKALGGNSEIGKLLYAQDYEALEHSVKYMCRKGSSSKADTFAAMSDGQKSGVIGNVDKLLGNLYGHRPLRKRFAEGRIENTIDVDEALKGKIFAVNISTEDTGNAGAFIMTLLKSRLYTMAVLREREFKMEGRNPQIEAPVTLMIDEAQNFVSSSKSIGLDEGNALNILRSTGLNVIFGFQTYSSLVKKLGKDTANDLLAQLTNKVIMANSDEQTIDWMSKNSPSAQRLGAHKEDEYENIWQSFAEHSAPSSPNEIDDLVLANPKMMDFSELPLSFDIHNPLDGIEEMSAYKGLSEVDQLISKAGGGGLSVSSMLSGGGGVGGDGASTVANLKIQQKYREEDKAEAYMTQGNEVCNAIDPAEIGSLAEGKAWVTWSMGGIVRSDYVWLDEAIH